jgi:hypothetical protein
MNGGGRPRAASESAPTTATADAIVALTGCPRGCGAYHELPCPVGRPIDSPVDYLDSGTFVIRDGAPALSSLREQVAA